MIEIKEKGKVLQKQIEENLENVKIWVENYTFTKISLRKFQNHGNQRKKHNFQKKKVFKTRKHKISGRKLYFYEDYQKIP